jgi:hypothetical protein
MGVKLALASPLDTPLSDAMARDTKKQRRPAKMRFLARVVKSRAAKRRTLEEMGFRLPSERKPTIGFNLSTNRIAGLSEIVYDFLSQLSFGSSISHLCFLLALLTAERAVRLKLSFCWVDKSSLRFSAFNSSMSIFYLRKTTTHAQNAHCLAQLR